jgi:hypothetical protein
LDFGHLADSWSEIYYVIKVFAFGGGEVMFGVRIFGLWAPWLLKLSTSETGPDFS